MSRKRGIFRGVVDRRRTVDGQGALALTFYRNSGEFYASSQRRMQSARSHIWVTYVRPVPPPGSNSAEAKSYFQYCLDWARWHPDREFRRIVGAPANAEMRGWLLQHHVETRAINNYLVRIAPQVGEVESINVGIIDDEIVFLTLSEEGQRMTGHGIENAESVRAFKEYYLRLWHAGESLESYVSRVEPAWADELAVESES